MASTTLSGSEMISPATKAPPGTTFKFPAFEPNHLPPTPIAEEPPGFSSPSQSPAPANLPQANGSASKERWLPRRDDATRRAEAFRSSQQQRHGRQKSLTEAIRTIRTRKPSVSQSAHEIADALKAPLSPTLVMLCGIWYATSILSNTSSKAILTALPKPVTLTLIQFAFVSSWCLIAARLARSYPRLKIAMPFLKHGIRKPSLELILTTLPLTAFQIGGHILNSDAMSRIPVSLVHTIKGLSPLFTVLAYRVFFDIQYSIPTYLSLIPLTLGVCLACSANFSGNFVGLLTAFGSALLFVTQNIVSKKLFNEAAQAEADGAPSTRRKPDKLNLLCYSSGLAFLVTCPIWLWSEGFSLIGDFLHDASIDLRQRPGSLDHGRLALEFIFNGTFHFAQSLVAFVLLSMVSPVTYSVASLIKRVFVISFAVVWFGNRVTGTQGFGIALTFLGLYLYDRTSDAAKKDKKARALNTKKEDALLPLVTSNSTSSDPSKFTASPMSMPSAPFTHANGSAEHVGRTMDDKKSDDLAPGGGGQRDRRNSPSQWLPPGTRQEETWTNTEKDLAHGRPGIAV